MHDRTDEPPATASRPGSLAPLRYRNYLLYWIGFATSNTGKNIELIGAVWLVSELTTSALLLGLLGIARAVPSFVLSPIAGVIVDRVDHRKLLFTTQGLSMVASIVLGLLIAFGTVELWHVYLQVAVQSGITAFDAAVRQALFPRLVPRSLLSEAVTLQVTAARSAAFVGPAIGGVAIATLGEASPFLLNGISFLVLMGAAILLRDIPPLPVRAAATFRRELGEGLRYILHTPVLRGLLQLEVVFSVFSINAVLITIIGRQVLGVGPEGLGGLLSAPAFGSLAGLAAVLIFGQTERQGRFTLSCTFIYATALVVFGISGQYVLALAALAVVGCMDVLMTVTRNTIMQLSAPGHMRGRVMANMRIVTGGIAPLSETQSGLVSGAIGGPMAAVAAAMALIVAAALTAKSNPALWRVRRRELEAAAMDA